MADGTVWLTRLPVCFSRSRSELQEVKEQIADLRGDLRRTQQELKEAEQELKQVYVRHVFCEIYS